jgi:hypothetical protein
MHYVYAGPWDMSSSILGFFRDFDVC